MLLIGPRVRQDSIGGCTVLFEELVACLSDIQQSSCIIVDSNLTKRSGYPTILSVFRLLQNILRTIPNCDVVGLHTTTSRLFISTLVTRALCKMHDKPLVVRKFGGLSHRKMPPNFTKEPTIYTSTINWLLKGVDLLLLESRLSLLAAKEDGIISAEWFPNHRSMPPLKIRGIPNDSCRRFAFVGQVCQAKGLLDLVDAGKRATASWSVDIYGPATEPHILPLLERSKQLRYRGQLRPTAVTSVLACYDGLVLPTFHYGEGQPGVILEAYAAGIPTVSTRWGAIPDIVEEEVTGLLVPPQNALALAGALDRLTYDKALYHSMCCAVAERRTRFDSSYWARFYLKKCEILHGL